MTILKYIAIMKNKLMSRKVFSDTKECKLVCVEITN